MEEVEVILEGVAFKVGPIVLLEEMMIGTKVEKTEGHGDSPDQEIEE